MIDVALPVGPFASDVRWLEQCIRSIENQTRLPKNLVIIDDGADLPVITLRDINVIQYKTPWRVGCADAWNFGIALAKSPLVFMMGADDWLEPDCLEICRLSWEYHRNTLGYYYVYLRYCPEPGMAINYEIEDQPCNAAMVHKHLWHHLGGFPPEAGLGAPDALVLSAMLHHGSRAGTIIPVSQKPLYNVRLHSGRDSERTRKYMGEIISVRNQYTQNWQPSSKVFVL